MSQLTIYLPEDLREKVLSAAKANNISTSKWIVKVLEKEVDDSWPEKIRQMAGSWTDFPSQEEIRSTMGKDLPREKF